MKEVITKVMAQNSIMNIYREDLYFVSQCELKWRDIFFKRKADRNVGVYVC